MCSIYYAYVYIFLKYHAIPHAHTCVHLVRFLTWFQILRFEPGSLNPVKRFAAPVNVAALERVWLFMHSFCAAGFF